MGPDRAISPSCGPVIETSLMMVSCSYKRSSHEDSRLTSRFVQVCSHDERLLHLDCGPRPMTMRLNTGRSNQKERTRTAIVTAAREAIASGDEITMPDVARRSLVSE